MNVKGGPWVRERENNGLKNTPSTFKFQSTWTFTSLPFTYVDLHVTPVPFPVRESLRFRTLSGQHPLVRGQPHPPAEVVRED